MRVTLVQRLSILFSTYLLNYSFNIEVSGLCYVLEVALGTGETPTGQDRQHVVLWRPPSCCGQMKKYISKYINNFIPNAAKQGDR